MSSPSLPALLERALQRLDNLLDDDSPIVQDVKVAGLVHAAWMRLKTWESRHCSDLHHYLRLPLKLLEQGS